MEKATPTSMPLLTTRDMQCYYRLEGREDRPVLMLAHALGQDHGMWEPQAADLTAHFRILRYDIRGHGASTVTPGDYSIEQLGRDALTLADALHIETLACCGLSLGGMIALWLAVHAPDRINAVVLANTSARPGADRMEARRQSVLGGGMSAVADTVMSRFFAARSLAKNHPAVATARHTLLHTSPIGYAGCCAAIRDFDLSAAIASLRVPTLVIDGEHDESLPWSDHGAVLATIAGARLVHLPAAHLSNLEAPRAFAAAVTRFLQQAHGTAPDGRHMRRAVLGDQHVDRALATAVSADFQDYLSEHAWGAVWTRPGVDIRTRRLLTLAITAALGRWDEFALHVRTGLAQELEWCEVEELLLHAAVYAGVPAANTGFRTAAEARTQAMD